MAFVKVTKTNAYFKRFQTKFRRRREYKTDYYARKRMLTQDVNKYLAPKYRLVARITNSKIITQIVYSTLAGDKVLAQATSLELKKFGLSTGFTSYSAAYATGLLLARKVLHSLKLADQYKGNDKIDGQDFNVTQSTSGRKPFTAILDIGIRRPTIGNRVFGVMKGACDGGINVPHSVKKFPGFEKGEKGQEGKFDAAVHRDRIFGVHIDAYREKLKDNKEAYDKQFSLWDKCLKSAGVKSVEDLFEKVFDHIKKEKFEKKEKKTSYKPKFLNESKTEVQGKKVYKRSVRLNRQQRLENVQKKIKAAEEQVRLLEEKN